MKNIRVGVADDQPVVLLGVRSLLGQCDDIELCFTANSISELYGCLSEVVIDVLIVSDRFDDDLLPDGVNMLERIRRQAPCVKVLFFGSHKEIHVISRLISSGASGFIGKSKDCFADLGAAVRHVLTHRSVYLPPAISNGLLDSMLPGHPCPGIVRLSTKEMVVASLVRDGLSIEEISKRLCRSPKTISNQKNAAIKKLGVRNDVGLAMALESARDGRLTA